MVRGRWWRGLLSAGLLLTLVVLSASPAAAAPGCTGLNCYHYYADITITAVTDSPLPVFPGSTHSYTIRVTNTGWRTGGSSAPTPALGPDSGPVFVVIVPSSSDEVPVSHRNDSGVPFHCVGYYGNGLACDTPSIPSGATSQFTVTFQVSRWVGTYACSIYADSYQWTEYNENNNSVGLTYQVGYLF